MFAGILRRISLKWRAVIGVTVLTVTVVVAVSLVQSHFMRHDFAGALADQQYELVSRIATDLDTKFDNYIDLLKRSAAQLPPELLDKPDALREYYRARPGLLASFDDLLIIAPDGHVIADYPEMAGRTAVNASGRPWFTRLLATRRPVIAEPIMGEIIHQPIIRVNVPILDSEGRVRGVLQGLLRLYSKNFLASLAEARIGRSGYFAILTRETPPRYVVHPDRNRILAARVPGGSEATSRALEGYEGSMEDTNSAGVEVLYSYKTLKAVNWVLIAGQPLEEAYAPLHRAASRLWLICLGVCVLVIPLVWSLAWLILRPVTNLRDEIDRLRGAGRGYRPVPLVSRDEIGDLTRSFNALMRERAVAEARQRDTEERLRTITDNLPALIAYLDAEQHYQFANRAFHEWFPNPEGRYVGRHLREVVGEHGYVIAGEGARRALAGQAISYQRPIEVALADGGFEVRTLEINLIPDMAPGGRAVGIYVLANDITVLKRTKDELRGLNVELEARVRERTAALQASNRELETFAYSVAHDFRAPLRAMDGYSALLLEEHAEQVDEHGREYLARIRASSNRQGKLIDDLLRLAELGQRELRRETVSLSQLAGQLIAELRAAHPARVVDIHIPEGIHANGDRALLAALLRELLDNAWKFSARRPRARLELGMQLREGKAAYFVGDDGVGFDMDYAHKIFVPFARLHGPEEFSGTGIGLALARRIVERHGGRLWVQAREGEGAVFWFTLGE